MSVRIEKLRAELNDAVEAYMLSRESEHDARKTLMAKAEDILRRAAEVPRV